MNLTIARITTRGLFGRRRVLLLLPLPLLIVGLAGLAQALAPTEENHWGPPIIIGLGFGAVLPIMALIIGTGVLGSEIDDGTLVHVLAKPLPRSEIVLAKLFVAAIVSVIVTALPMFAVGLIIGSVKLAIALAVACAVGAIAYCGLFLALSLLTRRPVLVGLLYILLWESLLGRLLSGTRVLSVQQYVITVANKMVHTNVLVSSHVSLGVAIVMSAVFLVGGTVLTIDRLRSFTLTGETS